jgi:hypothetical protein
VPIVELLEAKTFCTVSTIIFRSFYDVEPPVNNKFKRLPRLSRSFESFVKYSKLNLGPIASGILGFGGKPCPLLCHLYSKSSTKFTHPKTLFGEIN